METPEFYPSQLYCPLTATPLGDATSTQALTKHLLQVCHDGKWGGVEAAPALLKLQGTNQVIQSQEVAQTLLSTRGGKSCDTKGKTTQLALSACQWAIRPASLSGALGRMFNREPHDLVFRI